MFCTINPKLLIEDLEGEFLMCDVDLGVVHRLSGRAAEVVKVALGARPNPVEVTDKEILDVLLGATILIPYETEQRELYLGGQSGVSRRQLVGLGITALAVGVTTLILPTAAAAASITGATTTTTIVGWVPVGKTSPPVGLGTASSFAVLAGTTVTNAGASTINGNVGVSPGSAVTGFPPGVITNGVIHSANADALQAQADTTTAYNDAAGRTSTATISADLGGQTLVSGVYSGGALALTGTLTLDAENDPVAVFIFQAASTLITASLSSVVLLRGANPRNVFWQVGSSATLGTSSTFVGTILALTSITATTGANVEGRLLARNGAVTLDTNVITVPV